MLTRVFVEPVNRLIVRDAVGSCDLPAGMPTGHPEWMARLEERQDAQRLPCRCDPDGACAQDWAGPGRRYCVRR